MSTATLDALQRQRETELRLFGPDILIRDGQPVRLRGGPLELLAHLLLTPGRSAPVEGEIEALSGLGSTDSFLRATVKLQNALQGSGIELDIADDHSQGPHATTIVRINGTSGKVDLDQAGKRVHAALKVDDVTQAVDHLATAWRIMDGPLLPRLRQLFLTQRVETALARDLVYELACLLIILDNYGDPSRAVHQIEATFRSRLDATSREVVELNASAADTGRSTVEAVASVKMNFLKAISQLTVRALWDLPAPKPDSELADDWPFLLPPGSMSLTPRTTELRNKQSLSQIDPPDVISLKDSDTLPASIYLGDSEGHEAVEAALIHLLIEIDLYPFRLGRAIEGSWFRPILVRSIKGSIHLVAAISMKRLNEKIRQAVFDKDQALIDHQQTTGAAALITSLENQESAVVRVGSVLLVKFNGHLSVHNLTKGQMSWIENKPALLRDPETLLETLKALGPWEPKEPVAQPSETA